MPATPIERTSLKRPFVVLSALIALCTVWALYDEVASRRPWKTYQARFYELRAAHLRADLARAERRLAAGETGKQLEAARAALAAAEAATSGSPEQQKAYQAIQAAETRARQDEAEARLYLGFEKSKADAIYYLVREARHEGGAEEARHKAELASKNAEVAARAKTLAAAEDALRKATEARLAFQRRVDQARARVDQLMKPAEELRKRLAAATSRSGTTTGLEQYWVPSLRNSWGGDTVDRCQNCHLGVDTAGYSKPGEVLEARRAGMAPADFKIQFAIDEEVADAYQAVHDRICEELPRPGPIVPVGGQPRVEPAPPVDPAGATECRPVAVFRRWRGLSDAYCAPGHRQLATTRFLLKDSKGAVVAPQGRGPRVQDLELATSHQEPDDDGLAGVAVACAEKEVVTAFEEAEKASPYDVEPVFRTHPQRLDLLVKSHPPEKFGCSVCHGGQGAQTKGIMHQDFRHGAEDHHWNDPLTDEVRVLGKKFQGAFLEAKCEKCHREELTVNRAPLLTQGKKLFVEAGCWGCHPTEGYNDLPRRGPTLTSLASKTTPGWLQAWVGYPRGWRPHTRMPNFWPGAVDAANVPRPAGERVEQTQARHRELRATEVAQVAAYLWVTSRPSPLSPLPAKPGSPQRGRALFDSIGCRACHVAEQDSAARRSEASVTRDYAPNLWNVGDKASPEWLYAWVKNPRALWSDTKMPDLRLSDEEAADVTAWLATLRSGASFPAPPEYAPDQRPRLEQLAEKGKVLINKYGCSGCHLVKGFENAQKIGTELSEHGRKDPKLLDFGDVKYFTESPEHRENYASWVWTKLHTPRIYGYELVETRMPQFDFSDEEALALLTFLKGQTGERAALPRELVPGLDGPKLAVLTGERLVFWNGCRNCHEVEGRGGVIRDLFNEDNQSYAPPILTGEGAKVQPPWLYGFLKAPSPLRPWLKLRMPTFHFSDDDAGTLVKYFASASRQSFPYFTLELQPLQPARAAEASKLFGALQCTKCHVVGKLAPKQDPRSAAPDFLLARQRLRPDWIPLWLRNPNALMEGTRMPSFWDPDPEVAAPHRSFGGDKRAQQEALRDLLMHLGDPGLEGGGLRTASQAPGP